MTNTIMDTNCNALELFQINWRVFMLVQVRLMHVGLEEKSVTQ